MLTENAFFSTYSYHTHEESGILLRILGGHVLSFSYMFVDSGVTTVVVKAAEIVVLRTNAPTGRMDLRVTDTLTSSCSTGNSHRKL